MLLRNFWKVECQRIYSRLLSILHLFSRLRLSPVNKQIVSGNLYFAVQIVTLIFGNGRAEYGYHFVGFELTAKKLCQGEEMLIKREMF